MRRTLSLELAFMIVVLLVCQAQTAAQGTVYTFGDVTFVVPKKVVVYQEKKPGMPRDFKVFHFSVSGQKLMYMYLGNGPEFPKSSTGSVEKSLINGFPCSKRLRRKGNMSSGEYLITLSGKTNKVWPAYAHVVYESLNGADVDMVNKIVSSLRTRYATRL